MGSLRERMPRRGVEVVLALVAVTFALGLVLVRVPVTVSGYGTIELCHGGWAVIELEGEEWRAALPEGRQPYGDRQFPVISWPAGTHFDEAAGVLFGADGEPLFRTGERLRVKGSVVEVHGDPSPCFYTVNIRVEEIGAP
jgi:hypothetical protein